VRHLLHLAMRLCRRPGLHWIRQPMVWPVRK
jgi:hypothetical protein